MEGAKETREKKLRERKEERATKEEDMRKRDTRNKYRKHFMGREVSGCEMSEQIFTRRLRDGNVGRGGATRFVAPTHPREKEKGENGR